MTRIVRDSLEGLVGVFGTRDALVVKELAERSEGRETLGTEAAKLLRDCWRKRIALVVNYVERMVSFASLAAITLPSVAWQESGSDARARTRYSRFIAISNTCAIVAISGGCGDLAVQVFER